MKSKRSEEENAFREGLQDNTVKLSDDTEDPKSGVTNQDQQVTNEDQQKVITEEADGHDLADETGEENPGTAQNITVTDIPEADNARDDQTENTETDILKKPGYQ